MSVTQSARVKTLRHEAEGVLSVELWPADAADFAPFTAGSHIDLHLPGGLVRSYSLMNCSSERNRYVVAVLNDRNSRGGSRWLHEQLKVAAPLSISVPRNNFPLDESAAHSVLVAGGIGITPLYSMCLRLLALGKSVELIYCVRSRHEAALLDALAQLGLRATYHFDDEQGAAPDLLALLRGRPADAHFYCCGPAPMLTAFEQATEALGHGHVHIERFAAIAAPEIAEAKPLQGYEVVLSASAQTLLVPPGQSLLDALLDAGVEVEYSCCEGICGACETRVLEGEVEHYDSVLSRAQRESNKVMMVCVSRSCGGRLVLDL
ncbi:MAG: PDR/VanB family oxidoreductase [Janthinobacterium lividum]|uniref:PDR/VanB family oxidoreductase n=1 Tax=Pseudomonas sp. MWU16-30317 TaxID=2878095 RepID=UPI001CFBA1DF|nr:PDR/VanB family oxidoreductase [Pseudomonas sp. MWU16-30317]